MEVQSLSVVVPMKGCVNDCKFCVSHMHDSPYPNLIEGPDRRLTERDYIKRMAFARDNGCNTVVLTGTGEPLQNMRFLRNFEDWNTRAYLGAAPFRWVDFQTTGAMLLGEDTPLYALDEIGVTTIALSMVNPFDEDANFAAQGTPEKLRFRYDDLLRALRERNFTIRVCFNMTKDLLGTHDAAETFEWLRQQGVHQATFRVLYSTEGTECEQNQWISAHGASAAAVQRWVGDYIREHGRPLEKLPFGARRYSVGGISTVIDGDCMTPDTEREGIRYLILQPNCKLYTRWDDPGSILF